MLFLVDKLEDELKEKTKQISETKSELERLTGKYNNATKEAGDYFEQYQNLKTNLSQESKPSLQNRTHLVFARIRRK